MMTIQLLHIRYVTSDGEIIEEYIFSRTIGEIFLENIDWILINISKNY